jgi:polyisoprenoid-binding protein YceI
MKKTFVLLTILFAISSFSQKMMTRNGEVKFEASMPALEEVKATSKTASCVLDQSSGELAVLVLVKSFKFKVPLMEEHFNENYIESSTYPKATFKGKIKEYNKSKDAEKTTYDVEGELTIHGVKKTIATKITILSKSGKLNLKSNFKVKNEDFKIKIPNLVKNKIAENVSISFDFDLESK